MFTQDENYLINQYANDLLESERNSKKIIEEMQKTLKYQNNLDLDAKSLLYSCISKLQKSNSILDSKVKEFYNNF